MKTILRKVLIFVSLDNKVAKKMSKKKGLSFEEKRQRLQQLFFEKKDFFQLKELEKIAPKEKGITSMSVKDVLQSLVDDNMVDTEKIGTSVYFWSYPSKATHTRKRKIEELTAAIADYENKVASAEEKVKKASMERKDTNEREKLLQTLAEKEKECREMEQDLQKYKECDPEVLEGLKNETNIAKEAVTRWTDNIFSVKHWCRSKFSIEDKEIDKVFGIPEDFDYVDL